MITTNRIVLLIIYYFFSLLCYADGWQDSLLIKEDSAILLNEVQVMGYLLPQTKWQTPTSVSMIDAEELGLQSVATMVPAMNTAPGVRMEERSPGSYRLSIRGSLVRSPYGVRNVKYTIMILH